MEQTGSFLRDLARLMTSAFARVRTGVSFAAKIFEGLINSLVGDTEAAEAGTAMPFSGTLSRVTNSLPRP